jgi:hypothetical protein
LTPCDSGIKIPRDSEEFNESIRAIPVTGRAPGTIPNGRVKSRHPTIRYWIDAQDRVIRVNDEWARFAAENDGETVGPATGIVGQTLWSFIDDPTLCNLYREMVLLARIGRPIVFGFRCDAPCFRRVFQMRISGGTGGEVEFASTLESEEAREAVSLLDCRQPRNDRFLRMCSWCQRVETDSRWLPVEEAVMALGLMSGHTLPAITHGICDECHARMMAEISTLKLAS